MQNLFPGISQLFLYLLALYAKYANQCILSRIPAKQVEYLVFF